MRRSSIAKASRPWAAAVSRPRCRLIPLLLSGLILAPAQAMADEIPFFVTSETSQTLDLLCTGPWFRSSGCRAINPGTRDFNFYSAEINIFSPFGPWHCSFGIAGGICADIAGPSVDFCLDVAPDRIVPVRLTMTRGLNSRLEVNFPSPPCNFVAAAGFLGDSTRAGRPDRDVFRFDGEAGETITVTLERDGVSGSAGDIAELILREERGRRLDAGTGALPLELTATLPAAGSYAVEALEVGTSAAGAAGPFRGHFFLKVESDAGETRGESLLLEPTSRTEP